MALYKVYEQGIEVMGKNMGATLDGMWAVQAVAENILASVGLDNIVTDEHHWYSQQLWLNAFKLIAERTGDATLRQIGKNVMNNAVLPKMDSVEEALTLMDIAYHMNYRNAKGQVLYDPDRAQQMLEGIGHYKYEKAPGENKAYMICDDPYPCPYDMGIITSFAQRFEKTARVQHDDEYGCKSKGRDACRYIVTWK
ncbi:MAG TPA: hypothetical protein ENN19_12500 [Chloroflexi bacterium]|nr:hypothetical protein [Chloroflexota bacterium]